MIGGGEGAGQVGKAFLFQGAAGLWSGGVGEWWKMGCQERPRETGLSENNNTQ